ncbi:hypothetical protein KNE206_56090 [Kitasatospora sp. NE20-6]|uniref:SUKH-3 domain-containing protein n=1 Tax=Kitasatospora sp. NE20-6 TaxID=2859066 RepID=UPI0034DCC299
MISNEDLSTEVRTALLAAGWFPQRLVRVPPACSALAEEMGLPLPASVVSVIESLDGISLRYPHHGGSGFIDQIFFDAGRASRNIGSKTLSGWSSRAGSGPIFPLAQTDYGLFFSMSGEGAFYCGFSPFLGFCGRGIHDFLDRLVGGVPPVDLGD